MPTIKLEDFTVRDIPNARTVHVSRADGAVFEVTRVRRHTGGCRYAVAVPSARFLVWADTLAEVRRVIRTS